MKFINLAHLLIGLLAAQVSGLQAQIDPDWPCIQVLIPNISAASIWDGPLVDDLKPQNHLNKLTQVLIADVVEKKQPLTENHLQDYLSELDAAEHNVALTYLFNQFLNAFNLKRGDQIKTIRAYTKSQRTSAASMENLLDQMTDLKQQQETERYLELESELFWQKKIFIEREKSFKYLCELPQEIEHRAGEIARLISAQLD